MRHTFLNTINKFLFTFLLVSLFSVQVFAQNRSSVKTKVKVKPQVDTVLRENSDGTFDQIIIKRGDAFDCDDSKVYEKVDIKPQFIGGQDALKKYISDNLKYPENEARNKIEGRIIVQFTVNKFGTVTDARVVKVPVGAENLAIEAVRIVSKMPAWKPGKKNKLRVNARYLLPIDFKLKK